MVTARDVAARAGTSTAVVSYVFNDGPRRVLPATRDRVLDAAAELGYRPNILARSLKAGRTHSIGLIVPDICNPYFAELAREIENQATEAGNLLLIADSALSPEIEARHWRSLIERQVDSMVVVSVVDDPERVPYAGADLPVVALHPVAEGTGVSSLTIDYEAAAATATRHLVEHGYDHVQLLNGAVDAAGTRQHLRGYRSVVEAAGVRSGVWRSAISRHEAAAVVGERLSAGERPRAVYCTTDEQAFGVLYAAHRAGLRVPDDLAVVGFDGTRNCLVSIPALTTVQQPRARYAARALEVLATPGTTVHETLPYDFVVRASCGSH